MNIKKRLLIISFLIIFITFLIGIKNIYEEKIIERKKEEVTNNRYLPFKKIKYFKNENKERYIYYYENNKNLSYEEVITNVNIGLDKNYYTYIKKADITKNNLILVNKYLKLEKEYTPKNLEEINGKYFINKNKEVRKLTKEAKEAFERLSEDSIKNNTPVYGQSAYRTYDKQENLYNYAVKTYGKEKADNDTARPGHSEHQTGLAIDVSSTKDGNMLNFENTPSYDWMLSNAHKYGFILRYNKNKEHIHGYINEPWHYRYVGIELATYMHDNYSDLTYDEYYYKFINKN